MKREGKGDYIMSTRWVLTDKNDPLITGSNELPLKANARLVVNSGDPGRSDEKANVRVDAPCATTQSEMILTQVAASHPKWKFGSKDVSGAFLKGEVGERGLVIRAPHHGPTLADFPRGRLARVRKGVFGLPTAPRLWYLKVITSARRLKLEASRSDPAFLVLHDPKAKKRGPDSLRGCVCIHVDDFLWTGNEKMAKVMDELGKEFGFGSEEYDDFVFCGRRFKRQPGGAIHIDMME